MEEINLAKMEMQHLIDKLENTQTLEGWLYTQNVIEEYINRFYTMQTYLHKLEEVEKIILSLQQASA